MLVATAVVAVALSSGAHAFTTNEAAKVLSGRSFTCVHVEQTMNGFIRLNSDVSDVISQIFQSMPLNSTYVVPPRVLTGMNVQIMEAMQHLVASKGFAPFDVTYVYNPQGQAFGNAEVSHCPPSAPSNNPLLDACAVGA